MKDLIIIGGGAAGLPLSLLAARKGRQVLLLEKNDRVGRKLLATGNGRCNLANADFSPAHFHGSLQPVAAGIFDEFGPEVLKDFWASLGIDYAREGDKYFPKSLQASSVLNALRRFIDRSPQIEVRTNTLVTELVPLKKGFRVMTKVSPPEGPPHKESLEGRKVCIAMGGKASYAFGANGDGYALARSLGIPVEPLRPAICRLRADSPYLKQLAGLKVEGFVSLWSGDRCFAKKDGEVLFTKDGLSGPPVLDLSRLCGDILAKGERCEARVDLEAGLSREALAEALTRRMELLGDLNLQEMLEGYIHNRLILPVLALAGLSKDQRSAHLSREARSRLAAVMKAMPFPISGLDGFKEAQITVGGISRKGVTEHLESRDYPGLFFAGEVLDVDGDCGGYNLMFALASAMEVAKHI